jgi:NAD(P)H-hydrate epimerase
MRLPTRLLQRRAQSHKGDFGHVFIVAGSLRFSGAALLCAQAALRSGAGLVTLGLPESLSLRAIAKKIPEVMLLPLAETKNGAVSFKAFKQIKDFSSKADVIVIGPGMEQDASTQKLVRAVFKGINKPMVMDADGLNALSGHSTLDTGHPCDLQIILTPHAGEMSRLTGKSVAYIQNNRKDVACRFAKRSNAIVALKGHNTIVASPSGQIYINKTGNPGMSTAGSGDVLTGMIAAFMGQGLDAFAAAKYGVYLHGLAGDLAAKDLTEISLIASDIIAKIPEAIKRAS